MIQALGSAGIPQAVRQHITDRVILQSRVGEEAPQLKAGLTNRGIVPGCRGLPTRHRLVPRSRQGIFMIDDHFVNTQSGHGAVCPQSRQAAPSVR